jgi:hypothetical protein
MLDGMPFRGAGGEGEGGEFVDGNPFVDQFPEPFPVSLPVQVQNPVSSQGCRPAVDRRGENRQDDQEKEREECEQDLFQFGEHQFPLSSAFTEFRSLPLLYRRIRPKGSVLLPVEPISRERQADPEDRDFGKYRFRQRNNINKQEENNTQGG